jgi:hypothetical protein
VAVALGACGGSGDEAEVARLAESYYTALAERDWKAACETRAEREELDRSGGSCERVFENIGKAVEARIGAGQGFAEAEIRDVRVTGDVAHVEVVYPGRQEYGTGLTAVRENGRWFLEHLLGTPPRDPFARPPSPR